MVGIENASRIFQAAKHPKSFVSLDSADHLLSKRKDAAYVADVLASWAGRYLEEGPAKQAAAAAAPQPVPGTVVVAETTTGKFTNQVVTGTGQRLIADEPPSVGGDDRGPTPYDLLLAALGACKSMTMRLYAERKGYKLARAEVRLSHDKIHAEDCAQCETETGKIDQITTEITLSGELSEAERQKIFNIAARCPVHQTLTGEIILDARLTPEKG